MRKIDVGRKGNDRPEHCPQNLGMREFDQHVEGFHVTMEEGRGERVDVARVRVG